MTEPSSPARCPRCRGACYSGVLLCPVCVLSDTGAEGDGEDLPFERDQGTAGPKIGPYTLLEEISRGGMGVVYKARQESLNRMVALKVLPGAAFASASFRARFQKEAETAARLRHPGIVAIHEVGSIAGQPFISMDFIEGISLATRLAEGRLPPSSAAVILRDVARAVDHAHRHGVVHRDLKPSNILLNSDNQPVLTDFGLARFIDAIPPLGETFELAGSPNFLPPERISTTTDRDPIREDVYGLGAVLYQCLTGLPPFSADTLTALLAAVADGDPVPPRRLNHSVPVDLETICLKSLEKSPTARYSCAAEVADELDRFLRGDPILSRPLSPAGQLARVMRRKPLTSSLILALATTILVGAMVSSLGWRRAATHAADYRAVAEKRRVDLYSANLAAATAAMESGNRNQARELLARCRPATGENDLRGCEWFLLEQLLRGGELFTIRAQDHILTALAWHPDGKSLLSAGHDGSLRSWKRSGQHSLVKDREIIAPGNNRIMQLAWLADGNAFLISEGAFIRCRKPGESKPQWEIPGTWFSLAADGRTLAVSTGGTFFYEPSGTASLWDLDADSSKPPEMRRTFPQPARAVAISPDARWLAIGLPVHSHHDGERDLALLDLSATEAPARQLETSGPTRCLAFSPDSTRLVATTLSGTSLIHTFDVSTGLPLPLAPAHTTGIWSAAFTMDSRSMLTTSSDRSIAIIPTDGSSAKVLPLAHDNEIWCAAIHPSGTQVATGDKDGYLRIHPLPLPAAPAASFPRHPHFRYSCPVFSADGSQLLVCETSPVWKTSAWNPLTMVKQSTSFIFYPETIDAGGNAVWRDTENRQILHLSPSSPLLTLQLPQESWPETPSTSNHGASTDRHFVYQFSESGHAATVELASGKILHIEDFCREVPNASALSPGGRFLAAATWSELIIHDFQAGKTTRFCNDPHWAKTIVFSHDGTLMASGGCDGHIHLRRLPDFALVCKLSGHLTEVSGLAFSPDGRTLVSSEMGSGLRFWRLDTKREVLRLRLPEVREDLVFSPDGQQLAVTTCPPASPPEAGQVLVIPCPRDRER